MTESIDSEYLHVLYESFKIAFILHQKGEKPAGQGYLRRTLQEVWEFFVRLLHQNDQTPHEPGAESIVWYPAAGADGGFTFFRIPKGSTRILLLLRRRNIPIKITGSNTFPVCFRLFFIWQKFDNIANLTFEGPAQRIHSVFTHFLAYAKIPRRLLKISGTSSTQCKAPPPRPDTAAGNKVHCPL